ncbi:unnamed protein product [Notodromas monacha]|uniref:Uncharacterized protein n=1 Tax=Notodromas monacha TaxID=399045 RepID=A0A7R9G8V0_9CRUS|nr:unnamed protein product [Notodromas monacha]CAG0913596.1 unnamed protein product [Notodromas monacha]
MKSPGLSGFSTPSSSSSGASELHQRLPLLPNSHHGHQYLGSNSAASSSGNHHPLASNGGGGGGCGGGGHHCRTDSAESTQILIEPDDSGCDDTALCGVDMATNGFMDDDDDDDDDEDDDDDDDEDDDGVVVGKVGQKVEKTPGLLKEFSSARFGATRVDLPTPTRDEVKFPKDRFKAFIAWLLFVFCGTINMVSLSLVHDRVPDREKGPLPDIILDNIQAKDWALYLSEYLLMVLTHGCILITIFHKHRWILFRRCFFLLALLYLYRSVTMFVTVLPVASKTYECNEFRLRNQAGDQAFLGGLRLAKKNRIKGNTGEEAVEKKVLKFSQFFLVLSEFTFGQFFNPIYALTNEKANDEKNPLGRVWWFRIFCYLERNVSGPVPRRFEAPGPFGKFFRWARHRNHRP